MTHFEAPNLAIVSLSPIFARTRTLASNPLIPGSLAARTVNRVAINVTGKFESLRASFHGPDLSLSISIESAYSMRNAMEITSWAFEDLPTMLPLHGVEELHFQARLRRISLGVTFLLRIAVRMPAVSTLVIKYDERALDGSTDAPMGLTRAVAALLSRDRHGGYGANSDSDGPVLFPCLAHLELTVEAVPQGFCELLVPSLAQRALEGRRLKKLRIRLEGGKPRSRQRAMKWLDQAESGYRDTGIYGHVDSVEIDDEEKTRRAGEKDGEEPMRRLG